MIRLAFVLQASQAFYPFYFFCRDNPSGKFYFHLVKGCAAFQYLGIGITHMTQTILQEIIQQNPEEKIVYEMAGESGAAHNRTFTANVLLNDQIIGTGTGCSKKEAEQNAAKEAVKLMGYETN